MRQGTSTMHPIFSLHLKAAYIDEYSGFVAMAGEQLALIMS
jgi:hypothetical protein